MLQVFLNDVPQPVAASATTWGDLLAGLDAKVAEEGLLLTCARFDGVEEPSFRDPKVTARRLNELSRVEIETATPAGFLRTCLLDTVRPLDQAADLAVRLSTVYRRQNVQDGHAGLNSLATELRVLTSLVSLLGGPLQVDLGSIVANGITVEQHIQEFEAALHELVTAQAAADWPAVADVLEYDLEPSIRRWIELLTVVANRL